MNKSQIKLNRAKIRVLFERRRPLDNIKQI